MKSYVKTAVLTALTITGANVQADCGPPDASYQGSVCETAGSFCPGNTLPADGQILNISDYPPLSALLGTRYGGNGQSSFGLPNLNKDYQQETSQVPPQMLKCIVVEGMYPPRE